MSTAIQMADHIPLSQRNRERLDRLRPLSSATDLTDFTVSTIEADVRARPAGPPQLPLRELLPRAELLTIACAV